MDIIETKVQLHYRYMLAFFGAMALLGTVLYFFCSYSGQSQFVMIIVCAAVFISYFAGMFITIKRLTKNIIFKFGEKLFIEIRDIKTNKLREQYLFFYPDISSCELSSGSAKTCTFILNFKNRKKLKLILFSDEGGFTTAKTIIGFQIYEKLHSLNTGIMPAKPLLVKKLGSVIIISVVTLLLVNLSVHLLYDGNDHTSLLIGLPTSASLILGTLGVRKKQLMLYDEMMALEAGENCSAI